MDDADALGGAWVATLTQQKSACYLAMGDPDRAEDAWNSVLERYGSVDDVASQATLALGDLALGQDSPDAASEHFERVLSTSPDRYYQARALLGVGQAQAAAGDTAAAARSFDTLEREYGEFEELVAAGRVRGG
jgi:TolA-binding protein